MNPRDPITISKEFLLSIDLWIGELQRYDLQTLRTNPAPDRWSVGQVYMHLIEATQHFLKQARRCTVTDDNATGEASPHAAGMFELNSLPDQLIKGPPSNQRTPQPEDKEHVERALLALKDDVKEVSRLIAETGTKGKVKHPGLNYLNAAEWFQFAEMHLRHHLRQKKRIDDFLREYHPNDKQASATGA